ncbi:MAG TPA: hypothetical protein IGS52_25980 [Oscillatoriaceae cyanobacterium M33_DOE_052]|nr:hypothetical protein [Oscillatoriaceae cyanobacterium M33_DOE_052]
MRDNSCFCCGNLLLRHARKGEIFWFCTGCRQELPYSLGSQILPKISRLNKTQL